MRNTTALLILLIAFSAQACTTTFGGAVFVIGFGDLLGYIFLSLLFAVIIALIGPREKRQRNFWLWFIVNVVITPLVGLVVMIVKLTRRRTVPERRNDKWR